MSHTRVKLSEAEYFMKKMEESLTKNPDFTYLFSAFISAARSILWIMQAEFHEVLGWREWYDSQAVEGEDAEFLKAVNAVRVRSQKQLPLKTDIATVVVVDRSTFSQELNEFLAGLDGNEARITFEVGRGKPNQETQIEGDKVSFTARAYKLYRVMDDFPGVDVLTVSRRYITWLESLVNECERLFSNALPEADLSFRIRLVWVDPQERGRRGGSEA